LNQKVSGSTSNAPTWVLSLQDPKPSSMFEELTRQHQMKFPVVALCLAPLAGTFAGAYPAEAASAQRPNVILFFADDLGYRDLSCFGGDAVQLPNTLHLDQLAGEGIKLPNFYSASAVCSPTGHPYSPATTH
jgi:hypothetical protein